MPKFSTLTLAPPFRVWKTPVGIGRSVGFDTLSDASGWGRNAQNQGTSPGLCAQKISSHPRMVGSCVPSEIWEPVGPCGVFWLIATHLAPTVDGWGMELQHAHSKSVWALLAACGVSAYFFWCRWRFLQRLPPGRFWMLPVLGESLTYVKDPLSFFEEMVKASAACLVNCLVSSGYRCYRSCLLQILQV